MSIRLERVETALHAWLNRARNHLTSKTAGPRILCVLDLSTQHLPQHICEDLNDYCGVTAYDTAYGWLLYVPSMLAEHRADHSGTVPEQVWRLWEYASRFGASYILLDGDADRVDALPAWDW